LTAVASNGSVNAAETLIQSGERVDTTDLCGITPLMLAALYGHKDMIGFLLDKGACVNKQSQDGDTALMFSAWRGHADAVKVLLCNG
ncbi:hypothetical protein PHYSODRAFT_373825, partial [Phytophthora sojae]